MIFQSGCAKAANGDVWKDGWVEPLEFVGAHIAEKAMQGILLMLERDHWFNVAESGECEEQ